MAQNHDIMTALRERLTCGHFEPGQRLRPDLLRDEFGCSASTLREVLFRLSTEGIVDALDQRGFRMPHLNRERLHELTHLRILLESEGACLSVRMGGVAWEAQLSAAHHKLSHIETRIRDEPDPGGLVPLWSDAELEFHQTLIAACASEALKRTHSLIYHQFRQQLIISDLQFGAVPENVRQHQAILDAALSRDEPGVRQRIHEHLERNFQSQRGTKAAAE
ncbi:GntR family transcriptional regulator [Candidatus Rhodobacter oscarellae]|uniref:GntR family transcriptional regulator n=1 Tax=Candidatus Rhodobacter oscarellae TaxID=1675527 RepID=UPI001F266DF3|nr:GntR family transcriptional regulator [Candidatus Rhodobacter lobularis]